MNELSQQLSRVHIDATVDKVTLVETISRLTEEAGYSIVECNIQKPWGAYIRINSNQSDHFVSEFFPGLTPSEARLGVDTAELSPKLLIVAPKQRLSWQYHNRRAERWVFLTAGGYQKTMIDTEPEATAVQAGEVVQFAQGERHRLVASLNSYTVVAEIWQHTNPTALSDEDDIVRLADDYSR